MSKDNFIKKSKIVHGNKYDYSKVEYKNNKTKVCIICPEHGEFWQNPYIHLKGSGCPKCACANKRCTTKDFVKKAKDVHGNKYDYSKVEYISNKTKVCIICPEHGEFWQDPRSHLQGKGCSKCSKKHRYTTEEWVGIAKNAHGDKYDYSKVKYVNSHTKVCIICPEHGEFWMLPNAHILQEQNCPKCAIILQSNRQRKDKEFFIEKSKQKHGNKYDYSKVEYQHTDVKVCIICHELDVNGNEHGEFWQTPHNHLHTIRPQGCPKCAIEKSTKRMSKTKEQFISDCIKIYGDKFSYDKVEYVNSHTKVCITCPEHGDFNITPCNFLNYHGCPHCKASIMEYKCFEYFKKHNIKYEYEKTFDWLRFKGLMRLDFYLPDYNIAIECQGIQHFYPRKRFGGEKEFNNVQERDKMKSLLCKENNIPIEFIVYNEDIELRLNEIINKYSFQIKEKNETAKI